MNAFTNNSNSFHSSALKSNNLAKNANHSQSKNSALIVQGFLPFDTASIIFEASSTAPNLIRVFSFSVRVLFVTV
jgi:hypothetical protein